MTDYRLIYVQNNSLTDDAYGLKIYINSPTTSPKTEIYLGLGVKGVIGAAACGRGYTGAWVAPSPSSHSVWGPSAICGTIPADTLENDIPNEETAPAGVTFGNHTTLGTALTLGDLPAQHGIGVWIKRVVTAGASPLTTDSCSITVTNAV